ncbi:MAG: ATP-binding cassette domain-containing protein [Anaerostipes sp.]|jgi:energy-coupling factor transporter ATP-binding protein EcfA2/uncharacterized membrane protein
MEAYELNHLSFSYPNQKTYAVHDISMGISKGEFLVICGSSGSGKSTLLRFLKESLTPKGNVNGNVLFFQKKKSEWTPIDDSQRIGFVFQQPEHQIVTDKVWHELAFGLENTGKSKEEIRLRTAEISEFFGMSEWFYKKTEELSGGQKQLLNLASVMVMDPEVLLLDEPTAQLDPIAAQNFIHMLEKIHREMGTTIVICEHRLQEVCTLADRVLVLDHGQIVSLGQPRDVIKQLKSQNHFFYDAMPGVARIVLEVEGEKGMKLPLDIKEGKMWLEHQKITMISKRKQQQEELPVIFQGKNLWFRYEQDGVDVLKDISFEIKQGEIFGILGGNGVGKTTLLGVLRESLKPYRGKVVWKLKQEEVGMLPQNPETLFSKNTVKDELLEISKDINEIIAFLELEDILDHHPYDISGGEQQRVALGKLLLRNPKVLLLDEPTKGLDIYYQRKLAQILNRLKDQGITVVLVSHDVEFCSRYTMKCAFLFQGSIMEINTPDKLFAGNRFYTTIANKMARERIPDAVLEEDVILACKGNEEKKKGGKHKNPVLCSAKNERVHKMSPSSQIWMYGCILLELILVVGSFYKFHNTHYYGTSLLMIGVTLLMFVVSMEKRRFQTRELVVIAAMTALAVIGRCAFFMVPQFKPMVAVIMIAGLVMGNQVGFFVGAMTGFISNFMFGQGPWTPWQMLALGMIGLISGSLGNIKLFENKWILMAAGGIMTFFIYGGIVDVWTILKLQPVPSWQSAITVYSLAVPFNVVHSFATIIFLFLLKNPLIEKLNRLKIKYQMEF